MNDSDMQEPDWDALRQNLSKSACFYLPRDAGYQKYVTPDNLFYEETKPQAIVVCAEPEDVQWTMVWRREQKSPVHIAPRGGGHNYAGYSTTDGLLIHLGKLKNISVSKDGKIGADLIEVGAGVTLDELTHFGQQRDLYIPGGRCPSVGIAGLTLGGGIGLNDRKWGLTCDHLERTEVVLASGNRVWANEKENPDLFWACRGGAGNNFGINTNFVFRAQNVQNLKVTYFEAGFDVTQGGELMQAIQEVLKEDDRGEKGLECRIEFLDDGTSKSPTLKMIGQYVGDKNKAVALMGELTRSGSMIFDLGFWDAQEWLRDTEGPRARKSKSLVPTKWSDEASEAIIESFVKERPSAGEGAYQRYVTLFAVGGHTNAKEWHETAYPHRSASFIVDIGATWGEWVDPARLLRENKELYQKLSKYLNTTAAYVNFPDPDLISPEPYYGDNFKRLKSVKCQYDKDGVFNYPQGIPLE